MLYSYQLMLEECPNHNCPRRFLGPDRVLVNGNIFCHIEDGNLMESGVEDTHLITTKPQWEMDVKCASCGEDLGPWLGHEEQA